MEQHSTHRLPGKQFEAFDLMQDLTMSILLGIRARVL